MHSFSLQYWLTKVRIPDCVIAFASTPSCWCCHHILTACLQTWLYYGFATVQWMPQKRAVAVVAPHKRCFVHLGRASYFCWSLPLLFICFCMLQPQCMLQPHLKSKSLVFTPMCRTMCQVMQWSGFASAALACMVVFSLLVRSSLFCDLEKTLLANTQVQPCCTGDVDCLQQLTEPGGVSGVLHRHYCSSSVLLACML